MSITKIELSEKDREELSINTRLSDIQIDYQKHSDEWDKGNRPSLLSEAVLARIALRESALKQADWRTGSTEHAFRDGYDRGFEEGKKQGLREIATKFLGQLGLEG